MKSTLDPVCGMEIELADGAIGPRVLRGREYWFCSYECLWEFDVDPDRFTIPPPAPHGPKPEPPVDLS